MAPADGAGRRRDQVPGRPAEPHRPSVSACRSRAAVVAAAAGPGSWLAGCREYWRRRLAWVILVQALSALCLLPRAGLGGGGGVAVMAEQATLEFAGLLRQLRAGAQLTQQERPRRPG